tara:strand:- start:416 stop:1168 length:753 start_codon:yes stop_codon:yes gene_type:complete
MELTTEWTLISSSSVVVQKQGNSPVALVYSVGEPSSSVGSLFTLQESVAHIFPAVDGEGIWARATKELATITVAEFTSSGASGDVVIASKNGGFMDYNDTATSASPIALQADVWTRITNDGAGAFTNKGFSPYGVTELMNSSGYIDPTELSLGDFFLVRNDYTLTPATNNQAVQFRYTLGGGGGSYTLSKNMGRMDEGSGIPYRYSLGVDEIYMGDTNTLNNVIGLEIKTSGNGQLVNAGSVVSVVRRTV